MVPGDGDLGEDAQEQAAPVRLKAFLDQGMKEQVEREK